MVRKGLEKGLEVFEIKRRSSRLWHCFDWPEYWEESWAPEESCCHSDSSERPPVNAGVKNSQGIR